MNDRLCLSSSCTLDAALSYAKRGWRVLPLHSIRKGACTCGRSDCQSPGKHPLTSHGLKDATTVLEIIQNWWAKWPFANVGIRTGEESGLFVLDVDPRHGGDESLRKLEAEYGLLPDTVESITGGGGRHIFFKHPGSLINSRANALGLGLDIRADGGFVVGPESLHTSGRRYEWEVSSHPDEVALADLPEWLSKRIKGEQSKISKPQAAPADERIPEGKRNEILASLAGSMRRRGMSGASIKAALLEENRLRCDSPLPDSEVSCIATSVSKYPAKESTNVAEKEASQATKIVRIADGVELFHDPEGNPYASAQLDGHSETWPLKSKSFKQFLRRKYWQTFQKAPSSQPFQDALGVLESKAQFDGHEQPVFARVADHEGTIYLDLGDKDWKAVEITPNEWRVIDDPPIRFRRSNGMLCLPEPISGSDIRELRRFVNLEDDDDFSLVVVFLVASLRPQGPYPVLVVGGEQGSAKSALCRIIRALIDPFFAPLRSAPRDVRDLMITARNSWLLAFDNISRIRPWFSDAICRLSTGGGYATRELYSDCEEVLFDAMRPVLINGIEELATRSDLLDRSISLALPPISDSTRKKEAQLWREFEVARPRLLGAILDALSVALREVPNVQMQSFPRMADFAEFGVAAEKGLGLPPGSFIRAYLGNRESATDFAIEASSVGPAIISYMKERESWEGIAKELLDTLSEEPYSDERTRYRRDWPKTPKSMAGALRRLAPNLRQAGIDVRFSPGREGRERRRLIVLEKHRSRQVTPSARVGPQTIDDHTHTYGRTIETHADDQKAAYSDDLPPEWRDLYEERAAIKEFQGGLPREQAEAQAMEEILLQMSKKVAN